MCGIVGVFTPTGGAPVEVPLLEQMLALIRHRGPDESGIYVDPLIGMGSVRLSIIDLAAGQQPLSNEDGTIWIVFNGEIFNYIELMAELRSRGHVFRTSCDTEVIVHLYEEFDTGCLQKLNGQFAFAIWDVRKERLFLARDRVGIRPLFYTKTADTCIFGSEIKAILAHPNVRAAFDPIALDQIFTFWTTLTPRTAFRDIYELPPGHYMTVSTGCSEIRRYWELDFSTADSSPTQRIEDAVAEFEALFEDSVRLRLRADVPVAAYLSGGLDSSTTTDFILRTTSNDLRTFSIGFTDSRFDETSYQQQAVNYFGTRHTNIVCSDADIGREFADVIWHTEIPILRTAPVPMYLLSRAVRQQGIKVVVTGEGADEILGGYEIFKEAMMRRFWAREPDSNLRPLLLGSIYPYLAQIGNNGALSSFFGYGLSDVANPLYSHALRWRTTARIKQFFAPSFRSSVGDYVPEEEVKSRLAPDFEHWSPLAQAQYLETVIFLSGYLLSSQADRVTMANSVEGRYPFLDYRVIEFCAKLPPTFKLLGLREKRLLKRLMKGRLPEPIVDRIKQPYRAPISADSFLGRDTPAALHDSLETAAIERVGVFAPEAVARFLNKGRTGRTLSETDGMALVGILSTQLAHRLFIQEFKQRLPASVQPVSFIVQPDVSGQTL
jgi:asparagine synthase (glutamine-hydrolysing)